MARKALVVGAAGGIGIEVVRGLIDQHFEVVGTVMNSAQRDQVREMVPEMGDLAIVELSTADGIAAGLAPLLEGPTTISAVAVCAAVCPHGPLETASLAELRNTLEINTVGAVAVYQTVLPHLRQTKGRLALISSIAGRVALPLQGHYSASKFALEALGDIMRREARQWGVDIAIIEPAGVQTAMASKFHDEVRARIAALSERERALYGAMFEQLEQSLRGSFEKSTPPVEVAQSVVHALAQVNRPETRYQVGPVSAYFCEISRTLTDTELDDVAKF